jgi:probable HAF family extracellular repeat protein
MVRTHVCPSRDDGLAFLFPLVRLVGSWNYDTLLQPMKYRFAIRLTHADEIRRQATRALLALNALAIICVVGFASAASAQSRYQITRIPTPSGANSAALGINNRGDVVGYSFQGDDYQAFLYSSSDQSMTDVGSLGGKLNAACAVNDSGQVTGYSQDGNGNLLAFVFSRNQPIASLGTLEGASTSEAFGINNSGAVVGDSQSGAQNHRPVLFAKGSVQDLGLGESNEPDALETAYAINDSGQIVGRHSAGNNTFHAFLYINGSTTDVATLGGANGEALAINKKGQVVGDGDTADGPAHAFLFDHSQLKDLGTLPGFDTASYARGINDAGDIVGESDSADQKRAFLYTKGQLVELDKVAENLSDAGFSSLDVAYGINDQGLIIGYGTTSDNLTAAFVAVPEGRANRPQAGGVPQPQGQRQATIQPEPQHHGRGQQVSESNEDDYDVFYTRLSSDDGNWVEAGNYGYCYRPRVSDDWRPYRDGHWVWTDRGWYWDSNERFAWATYHYGRWVHIGGTGWCWVPGHQWAPAWVSWRESDQHVGWAPLPPEADVSVRVGISSWSDSYYDIGPTAYSFISYSHWREPSYARFIEPPERNVQIITQTKNVTNIVTNNNVINNFGPPVQNVAARTNQNIQQVKLALNPATGPNAQYGQTLQGDQLKVVAPPPVLKPAAVQTPAVQNRIANPVVEKGWNGVQPQDAEKLKKSIAEQNPVPKDLPKPTPIPTPQILARGQGGTPGPTGSPTPVAGQKQTPPNLVKPGTAPGQKPPTANVTPGGSPNTSAAGKKPVPPNLLGVKPSGTPGASPAVKPGSTPGASPTVKPSVTPGGSPTPPGGKPTTPTTPGPKQSPTGAVPGTTPNVQKSVPPNLNAPKPSPTPGQPKPEESKPSASPTPKPTGNLPPGQNTPHVSATPHAVATPTPERKPETATTPHAGPTHATTPKPQQPTNQEAPKPATTPHHEPANLGTPKSTPESKPREVSTPKSTPEVKAPPKQEIKTPPPQEKKTEETHPATAPHKPEGGGKEEGKHGKPTPTP